MSRSGPDSARCFGLDGCRVVVCLGAGGVGKTSVSAALALRGALAGKRTVVMTIDPAWRLAQALGLEALESHPRPVPADVLRRAGLPVDVSLDALMLDVKETFDSVVVRHARTAEQRESILGNYYYQRIANFMSGFHEYMAVEKLHQLIYGPERYDLVVLDTPPATHAVDFLEAPGRLIALFDSELIGWSRLVLGGGRSLFGRVASAGVQFVLKRLARFTGMGVLQELSEFALSFDGMYDGFVERAAGVAALLTHPTTGFVLVDTPELARADEVRQLREHLQRKRMQLAGLVFNRVMPDPLAGDGIDLDDPAFSETLGEAGPALSEVARRLSSVAASDAEALRSLRSAAEGDVPLIEIPLLPRDVHDLRALARIASYFDLPPTAPSADQ